jgi:hypothetical protein
MKNGKKVKLKIYNNLKIFYGTIDYKELKSIYITIQAWAEPKIYSENWKRIVLSQSREIKHTIYDNINNNIFYENIIVDLDVRYSGIEVEKKSFMNLEITLLTKPNIDFKAQSTKDSVKKIIRQVCMNNLNRNKYFDFYLTKRDLIV